MAEKKNIQLWEDAMSKDVPNSYQHWLENEINYLRENIPKNSFVLDVGCGGGRIIKEIYGITKNIIGIDHDEEAIKLAKKNLKEYSKIKILLAKAEELPFANNSFDIILVLGTFSNFGDNKIVALKEMKRVVKENGFVIIGCYSEDAFEERMKIYKKSNAQIKQIKGTTVIFDEDIGDNISEQFSKEELKNIFDEAGLKIVEIKKFGIGYDCKLRKTK